MSEYILQSHTANETEMKRVMHRNIMNKYIIVSNEVSYFPQSNLS